MSYGSSWTIFEGFSPFSSHDEGKEDDSYIKAENKIKEFMGGAAD